MNKALYWVWLAQRTTVSNRSIRELLGEVPDAELIYNMDEEQLSLFPYINKTTFRKLMDKDLDEAKIIVEKCAVNNYNIICYADEDYPEALKNIPDFPIVLYHRGLKLPLNELLCIAVVGTRKPSCYGLKCADEIAVELASSGVLVISGMAVGVDAAAHNGAKRICKPTLAVLGSAIDDIYPRKNKFLYEYMLYNGSIISEYPPGAKIYPSNFPERNRIISGLSSGVVVVEAGKRSGSLITANIALEQGKDVFSVPNIVGNENGIGTNNLIREGAKLVTSAIDILDEYRGMYASINEIRKNNEAEYSDEFLKKSFLESFTDLTSLERKVAELCDANPLTADELSLKTDIPMNYILSALTMLEIKGVVISEVGNKFKLKF
ncbi:MAG: DNA-protecting protein DprA [Ruminococcaceae bacterium]|nr:DNA-protecting protein DprA [Oscillospiraceae bacterium]